MKKIYKCFMLLICIIIQKAPVFAQPCSYSSFPNSGVVAESIPGSSVLTSSITMGKYFLVKVYQGRNYTFTMCGLAPGFDAVMTIYQDPTGSLIGYDDDFCGGGLGSGSLSQVTFVSPLTGYVRVVLTQYPCLVSANSCAVRIIDNSPILAPSIACPNNITVDANLNCGANVTFPSATATGNPLPTITYSQPSGSFFPVGTTTITVTATNGIGAGASCNFTVTVTDNEKPTFTCPANQYVNLNGTCQLIVPNLIADLTGNDNCGPVTFTQNPVAGTVLASSHHQTHNVVITANDGNGNTSLCTVVLTGEDVTQPTFTCQYIQNVNLNGTCQLIVPNLIAGLTGNDNCGTVTFTQNPTAGTALSSSHNQTHNITVTADDGNGNTKECTVMLTGKDVTKATFTCPAHRNVDLNSSCQLIVPDLITGLTGNDNCGTVTFTQNPTAGTALSSSHNQTHNITVTADDGNGNTTECTAVLTGKDVTKPTFTCPADRDVNLNGNCQLTVPDLVTGLTGNDNCGTVTFTQNPTAGTALSSSHNQTHNITVTADDGNGNTKECTVMLTGKDVTKPTFTCPAHRNVDLNSSCQLIVPDLITGLTGNDNCGTVTFTQNPTAGTALSSSHNQTHNITVTADDGNGNTTECTVVLTGKDVTKPTFTCPSDRDVNLNGNCQLTVPDLVTGLTGNDNCGTVTFTQSPTAGTALSSAHSQTHNITVTADDGNGNTTECTVVLTGKDVTKPTFICPANRNVDLNGGCQMIVPDLVTGLTGNDNCGTVSFTQNPVSGTVLSSSHNQTHNVVITASDGNGNSSSCITVLTAKDVTAPTVTCPAPKTISCDASILPANTGTATAIDNCDANPIITYSDVSTKGNDPLQSNYYNYTITRTWKAKDAALNWNTCNQLITVQDIRKPTAKCKPIEVYLELDGTVSITAAQINDGSFDNCSPVTLGVSPNSFNITSVGSNTVTLAVTDVSGNSSTCQATVTVNKRPTNLVYTGDGSEQYSDQQLLTACLKDQLTGTLLNSKTISFVIGAQSTSATTNGTGIASAILILTQDPAVTYTVKSAFAGDAIFKPSNDEDAFDILQEDARAYYTGTLFASTGTGSSTTLTLSATIRDITAETGDAATDPFGGDIRNAKIRFVNRDLLPTDANYYITASLPVGLVNLSDTKTGTATSSWVVNIGTADYKTFTIGIEVQNYYTRNVSSEDVVVNVAKSLDDFITGGGYLKVTSSSGQKAADAGTNNNFGFNVKFNKSKTSLQGNINTIIRRMEGAVLHVYQVKGNSMTSLFAASATGTSPGKATFNGKASIQDITNTLIPVSVDGNATLQVTMTDNGEPGAYDAIAITVWNKQGGLWFASNWDGIKTPEQILAGGNLRVNTGSPNPGTISNTLTLTSSINPSVSGQSVTFKATIVENNAAIPTGYVMFIDGSTVLTTVPVITVSSVTSASFSTSSLAPGSHSIKAYYNGDGKFASSIGILNQIVNTPSTLTRQSSTSRDEGKKYKIDFDVIASPNPSNHSFSITVHSNNGIEKISVRVVDVLGRIVENRNSVTEGQTFKLGENYRPGIYLVEAIQGNERKTLKLIKQ